MIPISVTCSGSNFRAYKPYLYISHNSFIRRLCNRHPSKGICQIQTEVFRYTYRVCVLGQQECQQVGHQRGSTSESSGQLYEYVCFGAIINVPHAMPLKNKGWSRNLRLLSHQSPLDLLSCWNRMHWSTGFRPNYTHNCPTSWPKLVAAAAVLQKMAIAPLLQFGHREIG